MSTQLLEQADQADEITGEVAPAQARLEGVRFDRATRQRLLVAEAVADTLESLSECRAWDRLDSSIQAHLLAQARRLEEHVGQLGKQRVVRSVEDAALRLKRLERRLEIAVDHLAPPEDTGKHPAGLFLGDFTEAEVLDDGAATRTNAPRRESRTARAKAAPGAGPKKALTRAEKKAAQASSRRVTAYIVVGLALTAAAVGWNIYATQEQSRHFSRPPTAGFKMDEYLDEVRVFVPASATTMRERDIRIVVSKEWLLRPESQRRTDAEGAHVWLSNRNVNGMLLTWDDGTPLALYKNGQGTWYEMNVPGLAIGPAPDQR